MTLPATWQAAHPRELFSLPFILVNVIALAFTVIVRVAVLLAPGGRPLLTKSDTVYTPARCTFSVALAEVGLVIVGTYAPVAFPGCAVIDHE